MRTQYCQTTDLSLWVLVFCWAGMGIVIWQFLGQVWFWQINWTYFTTGGEEAQLKTLKRFKLHFVFLLAACVFESGPPNQLAFNYTSSPASSLLLTRGPRAVSAQSGSAGART